MSRIHYADDEGGQSPGLFDANLRRALAGILRWARAQPVEGVVA